MLPLLLAALAAAPGPGGAPLGASAPIVPLTALDGTPVAAAHRAGKVTVLNFWATWCPPCRAETPDLIAAYDKLHGPSVTFLGIDTTETAPIVKTFVSAKGVPYPIALGGADAYNAFGIAYIPTTIVLDADGIVRARWIGGVTPDQLAHYVQDARAGRSSSYVSPAQSQIDALLTPEKFHFGANADERDAAVLAIKNAIIDAETLAQKNADTIDFERTEHAEGALQVAAGSAIRNKATTTPQKLEGLGLIATGSGKLNRWDDAAQADRDSLALSPDDPQIVATLARAYYRLHDYSQMIAQAQRFTQLRPNDGDGWSELGLAYQRARRFHDAAAAYETSLTLLAAHAKTAATADAIADVADTALDAANVYVALGDAENARRTFALANTYGDKLDAAGEYATLKRNVKERTQEGMVAVALAGGGTTPVVSVVPWTGPDLPGSLASTLKFRLIVAARAQSPVQLQATGLRADWVASFCADGLCSPQRVSFTTPASGVKTYEFQLVPPHEGARPGNVAIAVGGGATVRVPLPAAAER